MRMSFSGLEVWRIENFKPVPVPTSAHGKFYMGDSYIILKTTALKNGSFRHDIHYWLGKDTSQDEAGTSAILTVELDAALGGRAVPFARSSLNHEDIFILDTKSKIFQFNGCNSCIQERAKALEVMQYIKDTFHEGKCEVAAVEDGKLMADAEAGEFWALFGGFAPLPKKSPSEDNGNERENVVKLLCINQGNAEQINFDSLVRELLESNKCYFLDCGAEMYVWMGRSTSLQERKGASEAAEVTSSLLKSQGLDVKGLMKAAPVKEEPQPYIDCTGHLQVWRVNGSDKALLSTPDQSKFYTGDCYIFQYTYTGDDKEECLIGTWFGEKSVEVERASAMSLASKMVQAAKFQVVQARLYEGKEPIQFFVIFQSLQVFKGGLSSGYKNFIAENDIADDTYCEDGIALFRIQGSGSENMQALQVDAVCLGVFYYVLYRGMFLCCVGLIEILMHGSSYQRKLAVLKGRAPPSLDEEVRDKINLSAPEVCPPAQIVPVFEEDLQPSTCESEIEDNEGRTIYPYERLTTTAEYPVPDIDVTKRESYLSSAEFREKFSMAMAAFYKLPKWKQNKLKSGVQLF
nr:unnamed protein product [Digitaria exilis]